VKFGFFYVLDIHILINISLWYKIASTVKMHVVGSGLDRSAIKNGTVKTVPCEKQITNYYEKISEV